MWLLALACGCSAAPPATPAPSGTQVVPADIDPPRDERQVLREAIDAAAGYLVRACGPDGRFVYRVHLDDPTPLPRDNILRHAGAMYALAQHHRRWPSAEAAAALGRASRQLEAHVAPGDGWSAVFSTPAHREAKLGATGLALVAWTHIDPPPVDLGSLRALGAFVRYMQAPDGRFVSKYFAGGGRDDGWQSLYYPGEAALGATLLAERDPGAGWEALAERALMYLHRERQGDVRVPLDHWALLATRALHRAGSLRAELQSHAEQICHSMLLANASPPPGHPLHGCFTGDGRTTPTATRLEGLIAALSFLDDQALRARIRREVDAGIGFLLRARVRGGPMDGAMPRALRLGDETDDEAGEVRIDYVQHALSAWMDYLALSREQAGQVGEVEADERHGDPQQAP